jgi:hypothetical protein
MHECVHFNMIVAGEFAARCVIGPGPRFAYPSYVHWEYNFRPPTKKKTMSNRLCPVCGYPCIEKAKLCSVCGWDFSPALVGSREEALRDHETRLAAARAAWQEKIHVGTARPFGAAPPPEEHVRSAALSPPVPSFSPVVAEPENEERAKEQAASAAREKWASRRARLMQGVSRLGAALWRRRNGGVARGLLLFLLLGLVFFLTAWGVGKFIRHDIDPLGKLVALAAIDAWFAHRRWPRHFSSFWWTLLLFLVALPLGLNVLWSVYFQDIVPELQRFTQIAEGIFLVAVVTPWLRRRLRV